MLDEPGHSNGEKKFNNLNRFHSIEQSERWNWYCEYEETMGGVERKGEVNAFQVQHLIHVLY